MYPDIEPKNYIDCHTGWLMPNGDFYSCCYMEHGVVSKRIYKRLNKQSDDDYYNTYYDTERWLEQQGAIKLAGHCGGEIMLCNNTITQQQLDKLTEYLNKGCRLSFLNKEFVYAKEMERYLRQFCNLKTHLNKEVSKDENRIR